LAHVVKCTTDARNRNREPAPGVRSRPVHLTAPCSAAKPALACQRPRPRALDVLAVYHEVESPRKPPFQRAMAGFVSCSTLLGRPVQQSLPI
jgi:hypothetical protein